MSAAKTNKPRDECAADSSSESIPAQRPRAHKRRASQQGGREQKRTRRTANRPKARDARKFKETVPRATHPSRRVESISSSSSSSSSSSTSFEILEIPPSSFSPSPDMFSVRVKETPPPDLPCSDADLGGGSAVLDALVDVADKASRESTRHQRRFEAAGRGMTLGESPTTPQSPLCKPVLIPQTRRDDYTDADPDPDLGWMDDLSFHVWRRVPDLVPIARVLFERELRVFVSIDFDGHKRDIAAFSAKCFRDINKVMGLIAQSLKTYACCKLAVTQTLSYIGPDGVAVYLSLGNLVQYIANSPTGNLHCVFTVTTIPPVETSFHAAKTHVSL